MIKEKLLSWMDLNLSTQSKLGASDEVIRQLLSVRSFIENYPDDLEYLQQQEEFAKVAEGMAKERAIDFGAFVQNREGARKTVQELYKEFINDAS